MYVANKIFEFYYYFFTSYSVVIFSVYFIMLFVSFMHLRKYILKNKSTKYTSILTSPFAPSISVLVPMYNEENNAETTVRSLLSSFYVNYNIIIINDGSNDKTLQKLIETYELEKTEVEYIEKLKTKAIRGVYKSKNDAYEKLWVIDKVNGGKFDALNAGINFTENDYVLSVDGDCVLSEDALQIMIKPFLDNPKRVIATGGVIRIANNCNIKNGRLMDVFMPNNFVVRFQILEYIRSFLLARMGWSHYKGMMLISGALGMYDREILLQVNGYDDTLGEDMDVAVKMQKYMYENEQEFDIKYIPNPLCWTEAPETYKELYYQRKRWARGTITTLTDHADAALKPKYGFMGVLAYPYWFIFERLGPLIELSGVVFFLIASYLGMVNWYYTISFLIATYLFAVLYSLTAVLAEEKSFHQYQKKGNLRAFILTVLIEPFTYHVFLLIPVLAANIESIFSFSKEWGDLDKKGLEHKQLSNESSSV